MAACSDAPNSRASRAPAATEQTQFITGGITRIEKPKISLPTAEFNYQKNRKAEAITKPDKPLALPPGVRYNIVTGGL